jgi:hypothetical protein
MRNRSKNHYLGSRRALSCLLALFCAITQGSFARQILRTSHVPAAVKSLSPLRVMDPSQRLRLAIGLPVPNEAELDDFLRQLNDPSSAIFHQWLTPPQFTERFGPTYSDYETVATFAATNNLTITYRHPNRLVLDVEGSVADIENAFHTTLRVYQHPTEAREFYAPDIEPTLDLNVPILSISGLDNFSIPKPHHKIKPVPASAVPMAGSAPGGAYMGNDFRAAYVPGTSLTGAGQSVGLLQFDGYYASDITAYESKAGLPNVPLTNIAIDGGVSTPGSGNSEVCLDIEMVMSMAPSVSRIYVYEAPNPSPFVDLLSRMANDNLSRQLSCSWGGGTVDAASETVFKQMAAQGQSFFNATGDSDAFTSSIPFPSDSTNITQVGATTLTTTGPGGSYVSETVWNWGLVKGSYVGSSGGVSTYYGIPWYQAPVSMASNQGSTTKRNVPDVALVGDNVYVAYNNGTNGTFGGTSCAAPLWAGLTALINQQAAANGLPSVGFLNPAFYSIGLGPNYANCFHDTTTGNNFSSSSPAKYSAVAGYDLCTGWGTPIGNTLIATLATPSPILVSNSLSLAIESCTNNAVDPNETVTLLFGLKNIGSASTTNLVATLQTSGGVASPSAAQSYGVLTSGVSASRAFTFTANGTCGSTITATLQLQDGSATLGNVTFVIRLGYLPVPLSQNFDSVTVPALPSNWSNSVVSGTQNSWVTTASGSDTSPNSAFQSDSTSLGLNALVSPTFPVTTTSAQLTFRHNFSFERRARTFYDGGVLEIKIGTAAFTDILTAGGSFASGAYNGSITTMSDNPYGGRQAWVSSSSAWSNVVVNLPSSAAGKSVQFRWVSATDTGNSFSANGWYIDTLSVQDGTYNCCVAVTNTPPSITSQPTNQVVVSGGTATFQISATGTAPLNYQWIFAGTNLTGATNSVLTLSNVHPSQAGGYKVTVTNIAGSATSVVAALTVLVPPSITLQPSNTTVTAGSSTLLTASASGTAPLSYQWFFNISTPVGTNGPNLYLSNIQSNQAGSYRLVVTNSAGSATSAVANLAVILPPLFTLQPSNTTVIAGSNTVLLAAVTGSAPLTYQWYFNSTEPVGTNGPGLFLGNVQSNQSGAYQLVATNSAGSATSSIANLSVVVPPSFALQPSNAAVLAGSSVSFLAAASGSAPLTYQWYFNGSAAPGETSTSLSLTNVQTAQSGGYDVVVTNAGGSATSTVATLTILTHPILLTPSFDNAGAFTFILSGDTGQVYSIEASTNLVDWRIIGAVSNETGQTPFTDTNTAAQPGQNYRAKLAN